MAESPETTQARLRAKKEVRLAGESPRARVDSVLVDDAEWASGMGTGAGRGFGRAAAAANPWRTVANRTVRAKRRLSVEEAEVRVGDGAPRSAPEPPRPLPTPIGADAGPRGAGKPLVLP